MFSSKATSPRSTEKRKQWIEHSWLEEDSAFLGDALFKCEILCNFDIIRAKEMLENAQPHEIEHAFTSMTAYNFRHPDDK